MANSEQPTIPKPEVTDEHRERAKEVAKSYDDSRPTVVMPGTGNTVTGQAVADWVDDEGNPKDGEVPPRRRRQARGRHGCPRKGHRRRIAA